VATAKLFEGLGFPAVATASAAICASLGFPDGHGVPPGVMLAAVERIAGAVKVPVTGDLEGGYRVSPGELVESLFAAGAVGLALEDTEHRRHCGLVAPEAHAERLAAVKSAAASAGVEVVLNARIDVHPDSAAADPLHELRHRGALYAFAGADCLYPIRLQEAEHIRELAGSMPVAVNVMVRRGRRRFGLSTISAPPRDLRSWPSAGGPRRPRAVREARGRRKRPSPLRVSNMVTLAGQPFRAPKSSAELGQHAGVIRGPGSVHGLGTDTPRRPDASPAAARGRQRASCRCVSLAPWSPADGDLRGSWPGHVGPHQSASVPALP
jgi:phosphoenolpyruvate phosphomutase-like protein